MKKILLIIILLFTINVKAETITVTSNTDLSDKKIEDNREQSNVIIVNNGNLNIKNSTVNKEGNGTDNVIDSYKNSAIVVYDNSKLKSDKLEVNTSGDFAHGIYFNSKTNGIIKNSIIKTNNKFSVGIINDGADLVIENTNIETYEHDSACIYAINGKIEISKSNIISDGVDSPLIKAASKIVINDSNLNGKHSEGIIGIPGADITIIKSTLENNNITAEESNYKNILLYNPNYSMFEGSISFTAKDSKINTIMGNTFDIVNADVTINLENNEISNTNGVFLKTYANILDEETNNNVKLNMKKQLVKGNMVLDNNTKIDVKLDESEYIGTININASSQEVNLTLTKDSKITLTGNSYVSSVTNGDFDNSNINLNGYKLYINGEELSKDNIKHLNEKNDTIFIILGFIIGVMLGYSVIYLYIRTKKGKK